MKNQITTVKPAATSRFSVFVRLFALTSLLAGSLLAVPALGAPAGELDPSFGARGYGGFAAPSSLVQQPDGKLVVIGSQIDRTEWWDLPNIAIARLDPYGSGSNGWAGLNELSATAHTSSGEVTLQLRRTGGFTGPLSVDYRTVDNTAIAGTHYVASSGTLNWPDGDTRDRSLSITVLNDQSATNFPYFNVELFNSSGGLAVDQATVWISHNAPPVTPPVSPPPVVRPQRE